MMFYCTARGAYPIPANILKTFAAHPGSSGSTATQQQFTDVFAPEFLAPSF